MACDDYDLLDILEGIDGLFSPEELAQLNEISSHFSNRYRSIYALGKAHFRFDVGTFIPERFQVLDDFKAKAEPLSEVVAKMLRSESHLDINPNRIISYHGSTRSCLDYVVDSIIGGTDQTLSFVLPNWHFWDLGDSLKNYGLDLFEAINEEQLVEGFKKKANKGKIGVLILSDPNTPLMYRLSSEALQEIDHIALDHGVDIVVDDVLRGVQPLGERESIAKHLTKPYIIEGFSKRFGEDAPLGSDTSYVVVPEGVDFISSNCLDESGGCDVLTGAVLKCLLDYLSEPILAEYERRNQAFDEGFYLNSDNGAKIMRPSPTHITSLIELPSHINGFDFYEVMKSQGVFIFPMQGFYPEVEKAKVPSEIRNKIRFSVGQENPDRLLRAGQIISDNILVW